MREVLEPDDRRLLVARHCLGVDLLGLGHAEEAARILAAVTRVRDATIGPADDDTIQTRARLADAFEVAEAPLRAAQEYATLVAVLGDLHGADAPMVVEFRHYRANALGVGGSAVEAVRQLRGVVEDSSLRSAGSTIGHSRASAASPSGPARQATSPALQRCTRTWAGTPPRHQLTRSPRTVRRATHTSASGSGLCRRTTSST